MAEQMIEHSEFSRNGHANGAVVPHIGVEKKGADSGLYNRGNAQKEKSEGKSVDKKRRCCSHGPKAWCRKYWWEGQQLQKEQDTLKKRLEGKSGARRFLIKYRRIIGFCIPALLFHFFWWAYVITYNPWSLFPNNYAIMITSIFGSLVAGMTSEGGGAVAFPVLTLVLGVKPSVARDFTLMIQSCGMTAASFTILFMGVCVEWHSLICCGIGSIGGTIFGLHVVDPNLTPPVKKLGFVSIWFAFASVLIFVNRTAKRRTFIRIPNFNWWKFLVLVLVGFIGGIFSAFSGSGLDICSFMILTLLFRVSEKVATPTSVLLMAFNSLVGFYWRGVILDAISDDAWQFLVVCIPVVVIGAPVGSVLGSHFHRLVLAGLVIVLDSVAIATAFAIIRPLPPALVGGCCGVIVGCFGIFMGVTYAGQKILNNYEKTHVGAGEEEATSTESDPEDELSDTENSGETPRPHKQHGGQINAAYVQDTVGSSSTKI